MATHSGEHETGYRKKVRQVFLFQGSLGLAVVVLATILRVDATRETVRILAGDAIPLILLFFAFSITLQFLKFEATNLVYVSLGFTVFAAMYPLLGVVISAWLASLAAISTRVLALFGIGGPGVSRADLGYEVVNAYRMFATYGAPVVAGGLVYEALGGEYPLLYASKDSVLHLVAGSAVIGLGNMVSMFQVMRAYGYPWGRIVRLSALDMAIFFVTIPYAITVTLSFGTLGWGALLALAFTGTVANLVARNLAIARAAGRRQLQRLASLSHIGKTISLRFTNEQLLMTIYTESSKVVDASLFSIALVDERTNELSFELDIRDGQVLPKERIPIGGGLNSWVVMHHQPLLLGSRRDEKKMGLLAVEDGMTTEAWLGVPMIARDRVIGVMSVQSYRKNAFTRDDEMLMTAIANQAAVALENSMLYKDMEGLTVALEQRVQERTLELREANLRLLAADRSKNQFLANMSHELRTPLNSVIGFSSVLLENLKHDVHPRMYKFLENIHTAGNHLLELINDILDLSKIEAGKLELRPETFDIRDTVASVERVMRGLASEANVQVNAHVDSNVPLVRLDEGRVKQILFNLLSNAIKFSPDGGPVRVNVHAIPAAESVLGLDSLQIEVADSGIGIAEEHQRQIFEEFYQTEEGRKSRRGGTGLGLSLVRNFVELHFGRVEVDSELGSGAIFTLLLPIDYDDAAARVAVADAARMAEPATR
ncbi:MAG: GAF domain-containing sensor histidine kinase [Thermoanaerobaculia bacterium]